LNSYQIKADEKRGVFEPSQEGSSYEVKQVEKYSMPMSSLANEQVDTIENIKNARNKIPTTLDEESGSLHTQ
jgi:hypothetical protein